MNNVLVRLVGHLYHSFSTIMQQCRSKHILSTLHSVGRKCSIGTHARLTNPENVKIKDYVYIGDYACFMSAEAPITIGSHVVISSNCTIITGNHRISKLGVYMDEVHIKEPENGRPVLIEDDVWIGADVTVLKGVTIGRGSVIGACSIVTKDIPPYSIYYTQSSGIVKERFSISEIDQHEAMLKRRV